MATLLRRTPAKPCREMTWDDYLAEGRKTYRWSRLKRWVDYRLHPAKRRRWQAYRASIDPWPLEVQNRELEEIRDWCEDERRMEYRDRRIRRRLPPWAGIKVFQQVYIFERKSSFAIIQRHYPHHDMPVWQLTRHGFQQRRPYLSDRYFLKMKLHFMEDSK